VFISFVDEEEVKNRWHQARLSQADKTIWEIGNNAIKLIKSYPENSTARTSLVKSTSIGTFMRR
jgi:hypothetical protein